MSEGQTPSLREHGATCGSQSAAVRSGSLNLPISLGGQHCCPHFTDGETEVPGTQKGLRSEHLVPASHSPVSALCPGKHRTGGRGRQLAGLITLTVWRPLRPEASGGKY